MNTEQEIQQLKRQVKELLDWKAQRVRQQIVEPLDETSKRILTKDFLRFFKEVNVDGQLANEILVNYGANDSAALIVYKNLRQFSVDTTADTIKQINHGFENDDAVFFQATIALPTPLLPNNVYFVWNATVNTFQVSTSSGGAGLIDISTTGLGDMYTIPYLD